MHQDSIAGVRLGTRVGHVVLFVALAVVPVLALNSLATATPTSGGGTDARPGPTDAPRACLSQHGVTLPARTADGTRPVLTPEQRHALREAAAACGFAGARVLPGMRAPTDEQRRCLADQGVTPPALPTPPTGPTGGAQPDADQRAARRQAAEACGLVPGVHQGGVAGTI